MKMTGNTILITGGASGIGRGLAEALHQRGNKIVIAGRRRELLEEVAHANDGMQAIVLDIEDPASIRSVADDVTRALPDLNVLINNAGIMKSDDASGEIDDEVLVSTVTTNVMGTIRLTSALLPHLKSKSEATVVNVTSGLAFTPLAMSAIYSATKAALHSYTLSQRYRLRGSGVQIVELAPPYVQTELTGSHQANDPNAMPLKEFIEEAMRRLETDGEEVLVQRAEMLRKNAGPNEWPFVEKFNDMMREQRPQAN